MKPAILPVFFLSIMGAAAQQPVAQPSGTPPARVPGGGFTQPAPIDFNDHTGWKSMFDGETLNGWDGNKNIWSVERGAIVAESTCEKPVGTTYLIWQGGEPCDFELTAELKGEGAGINSGIQYRSFIQPPPEMRPLGAPGVFAGRSPTGPCPGGQPRGTPDRAANAKWNLGGPQSDFDGSNRFTGQYYEGGTGRHRCLAGPGSKSRSRQEAALARAPGR